MTSLSSARGVYLTILQTVLNSAYSLGLILPVFSARNGALADAVRARTNQ